MHWPGQPINDFKEGNRARWRGRASNPVGDGIRSRAGSTPATFRHFPLNIACRSQACRRTRRCGVFVATRYRSSPASLAPTGNHVHPKSGRPTGRLALAFDCLAPSRQTHGAGPERGHAEHGRYRRNGYVHRKNWVACQASFASKPAPTGDRVHPKSMRRPNKPTPALTPRTSKSTSMLG